MRKLLMTFGLILCTSALFGQNTFKYELRANGGIRVGSTGEKIDSISVSNDTIYFYSGATRLFIAGEAAGAILASDTAGMLTTYSLISEVRAIVNDSLDAAISGAEVGLALADSLTSYVTPTQLSDSLATVTAAADSSLFVTITRLTDSLDVVRSDMAALNSTLDDIYEALGNIGIDLQAPTIDSLEIGRFTTDTLVIFFSEKMNTDSVPAASTFYLTEDGNEMGIASIEFQSDSILFVLLDSAAVFGSTYLLDYTRAFPYLRDSSNNPLVNFTDKAVTNYMPEPEAPDYSYDMVLTSQGSGVATFRVAVSTNTTFTLDGDARFYSNAAGDADETTTWEATSGGDRIRYIRLASGTANLGIPDVRNITKFGSDAGGWSDGTTGPYPTLALTTFTNLTLVYFANFATNAVISGDITNLTSLYSFYLNTANTVSGDISDIASFTSEFMAITGNAIEGDIGTSSVGTGSAFTIVGGTGTFTYTTGKNWKNAEHIMQNSTPFLARADVINMWLDMDASSPSITSKTLIIYSTPTLSDTSQGGIWGDFDGETSPSALAIAIKSLAVTKGNTLTLSHAGIVALPGGSGDGSGFPAGFGDWYRSANPDK